MDCTFKTQEGLFNYRVGAIIVSNNKLLMVRNIRDPYYYSVGGRVKVNETSEQAAMREAFEETGVHFEIDRLGFIHESFFELEHAATCNGAKTSVHELCFFYYMKEIKDSIKLCSGQTDQGAFENLEWLEIDKLAPIALFPEFLKTELKKPSREVKHIVTIE